MGDDFACSAQTSCNRILHYIESRYPGLDCQVSSGLRRHWPGRVGTQLKLKLKYGSVELHCPRRTGNAPDLSIDQFDMPFDWTRTLLYSDR